MLERGLSNALDFDNSIRYLSPQTDGTADPQFAAILVHYQPILTSLRAHKLRMIQPLHQSLTCWFQRQKQEPGTIKAVKQKLCSLSTIHPIVEKTVSILREKLSVDLLPQALTSIIGADFPEILRRIRDEIASLQACSQPMTAEGHATK